MDVVCGWADNEDDDQKIQNAKWYIREEIFLIPQLFSDSVDHGILLLIPRFQEDLHKCSNPKRISTELGKSDSGISRL